MPSIFQSIENVLDSFGRSRFMSIKVFKILCGPVSGVLTAIVFLFSMVAAHQIPPLPASASPEEMVQFFKDHEVESMVGVALILLSAAFYLPYTASVSAQMRRIPNLHYLVSALQLASGAAGVFTWIMPAEVLALITYRLDRDPLQTQTLVDYFFFTLLMPWPTFIPQAWALSYATLVDQSPKPVFPKIVGVINFVAPMLYATAIGMHTTKTGPFAWQGVFGFYMFGFVWISLVLMDSFCLWRAILRDNEDGSDNADYPALEESKANSDSTSRKASESV